MLLLDVVEHPTAVLRHGEWVGELSSELWALTRLITAIAAVVAYVALHLAMTAGIDLRERNAFREAPAQAAAFVAAVDRGQAGLAEVRAVDAWFSENTSSGSGSRAAISLAADSAEDGDFSLVRRFVDDVGVGIEQDQAELDQEFEAASAVAWPWTAAAGVPGGLSNALLSIHSREEQLVGALSAFGPVIAVGRPGEPLPHLGRRGSTCRSTTGSRGSCG